MKKSDLNISRFGRLSIKKKLVGVVLLTASIAISIASFALVAYDQVKQRHTLIDEISILAKVVAMRSAVALTFGDKANAAGNLSSLSIRKNIRGACIYDNHNQVFASYGFGNTSANFQCPSKLAYSQKAHALSPDNLSVYQPVKRNGETIGMVYIDLGLEELYQRIREQLAISTIIILASLALAFAFTIRLQKQIYRPIAHLGRVASEITQHKNYSIRAMKTTEDELGRTVDAFNNMLQEIEEDKKHLFEIAYYDHLTHLPNRRKFAEDIQHVLQETAESEQDKLAVMFLDLDQFKEVNDTLGHDVGDMLLIEFSRRIEQAIPETASAYRLGGDEFTVILESLGDDQEAEATAKALMGSFREPMIAAGHELRIASSIGIYISDGNDSATSVMKNADIALYQVKASGRGHFKVYESSK